MPIKAILATIAILFVASGCARVDTQAGVGLMTDVKEPMLVGNSDVEPMKEGKACASNFLGLNVSGDASIQAAKEAGGIDRVAEVDREVNSTFGIKAKSCTIVRGE